MDRGTIATDVRVMKEQGVDIRPRRLGSPPASTHASRFAAARLASQLSQSDLKRSTGVARAAIRRAEAGGWVRASDAELLAAAVGAAVDELWDPGLIRHPTPEPAPRAKPVPKPKPKPPRTPRPVRVPKAPSPSPTEAARSRRVAQVVDLWTRGVSPEEISRRLGISRPTVYRDVARARAAGVPLAGRPMGRRRQS